MLIFHSGITTTPFVFDLTADNSSLRFAQEVFNFPYIHQLDLLPRSFASGSLAAVVITMTNHAPSLVESYGQREYRR